MRAQARQLLRHSPERVFDHVADLRHEPDWAPDVHRVEQVAGDGPEAGARYEVVQVIGRHEVVLPTAVTVLDRPRRVAWRVDHPALEAAWEVRIERNPKGCIVVHTTRESWPRAPWHLRLVAPWMLRKQLRRRLAALKAALDKERREEGLP